MPQLRESHQNFTVIIGVQNLDCVDLPEGEKSLRICLAISMQYMNMT